MSLRHYGALIVIAAVVTLIVTPLVRAVGRRYGLVDQPGGRKVHSVPIPRLGGVAIFAGVAAAIAVQVFGEARLGWAGTLYSEGGVALAGVAAGMLIVFLVGLADDIVDLAWWAKLLGQLLAAGVVVAAGLRIDYVGSPTGGGLIMLGLLSVPVTIVYLVGFANVINLIDGLDGLAAGLSAIAAMSFLILAAPETGSTRRR